MLKDLLIICEVTKRYVRASTISFLLVFGLVFKSRSQYLIPTIVQYILIDRIPRGAASGFPLKLSFPWTLPAAGRNGNLNIEFWVLTFLGQNETSEIRLWLCLEDSWFQKIIYFLLFSIGFKIHSFWTISWMGWWFMDRLIEDK